MQEIKSPVVDSVLFTAIKEHKRDSCHPRSTFVPKGGSVSSMEMLDVRWEGFWERRGRRAQEGRKLAHLEEQ